MKRKTVLITGANGEIGHSLISHLSQQGSNDIVALDINPLDTALAEQCMEVVTGDILDEGLFQRLKKAYQFDVIYHLAALLSTSAERQPQLAHRVNVQGSINVLNFALEQGRQRDGATKVLFPSSIAVYGMPDLETKFTVGSVRENEWTEPITIYGANKLYVERLGCYYSDYYRQLDAKSRRGHIHFLSLRFPGLISADTVPTGGTSDYIPEMLHAVAQGKSYRCFVSENARIPFMVMPDAVKALLQLEAAPTEQLTRRVYNVTAFNPSAVEVQQRIQHLMPDVEVTFEPDCKRQRIVDSWPVDMDDLAAREDWGWQPDYSFDDALNNYLLPTIVRRDRLV